MSPAPGAPLLHSQTVHPMLNQDCHSSSQAVVLGAPPLALESAQLQPSPAGERPGRLLLNHLMLVFCVGGG